MRIVKNSILTLTLSIMCGFLSAAPVVRGVALVADEETYKNCRNSIEIYANSIKKEGLTPFIIVDRWGHPDSIRAALKNLYSTGKIEGAVLIGNIPVPMIRDAQHLTTAFKMDQRRPWEFSSVPSDRFYDDFDLKFEYIKRDSVKTLYHYYRLKADSPHRITCDIYSARIKPPIVKGKSFYNLIDEYLNKAVEEKMRRSEIDNLTYFSGHGYNSNCMVSRADERVTLTQQFHLMNLGRGTLNFIDYTFDDYVRYRLMSELSREELDLAILHHHGAEDTQFLNGSPITNMPNRWLDMTRKFFRNKIRGSKDTTESKRYYIENYNVPESWVMNAFNPETMKRDSIEDAMVNISISDMEGYNSNAKVIIMDACFNGSFHLEDYISGHYIFNEGRTVVVKANSVNTLQDTWTNELIGLLDLGVSVGNWTKGKMTLESHLIGDPTYTFKPSVGKYKNLSSDIVLKKGDAKFWRKMMKDSNPEVRALSIKMLWEVGKIDNDELLNIQRDDISPTVRMQAFNLLNKRYNSNTINSIKIGLYDNYELIRRLSAREASTNSSPLLIDDIFKVRYSPGTSKRVEFQLKGACESYSPEVALAAFERHVSSKSGDGWYSNRSNERRMLEYSLNSAAKDAEALLDKSVAARNKRFTITALRNSNNVTHLDTFIKFMEQSEDNELRALLAEAFGWFTNSWKKDVIIKKCREWAEIERDTAVKQELERTIYRLSD